MIKKTLIEKLKKDLFSLTVSKKRFKDRGCSLSTNLR